MLEEGAGGEGGGEGDHGGYGAGMPARAVVQTVLAVVGMMMDRDMMVDTHAAERETMMNVLVPMLQQAIHRNMQQHSMWQHASDTTTTDGQHGQHEGQHHCQHGQHEDQAQLVEQAQQLLLAHQACTAMGVSLLPDDDLDIVQCALQEHAPQEDTCTTTPTTTHATSSIHTPPHVPARLLSRLQELCVFTEVHTATPMLGGACFVDALCVMADVRRVVVDVLGVQRGFGNQVGVADGAVALKHAVLRAQGVHVATVDRHMLRGVRGTEQREMWRRAVLGQGGVQEDVV